MFKKIYIAGPLFNTHEKRYLEKIAIELESNGFECFLPHRDQKGVSEEELIQLDMSTSIKEQIFNNDIDALQTADLTVCLLYTSPSPRDATLSRMPSSA